MSLKRLGIRSKRGYLRSLITWGILGVLALLAVSVVPGTGTRQASAETTCTDGTQDSGALYRICMPDAWNGILIVYARGGTYPQSPLQIFDPVLIPGPPPVTLSQLLTGSGFAFATSSYSRNGLATLVGVDDLADLVGIFKSEVAMPARTVIVGFSDGGLASALSVERRPDLYDGGLAGCAPLGSAQDGINYTGDVRVIFEYFFPNLIPGHTTSVPPVAIREWEDRFAPSIRQALLDNPDKLYQIMAVAGVPVQVDGDLESHVDGLVALLYGGVSLVEDYMEQLGGRMYSNIDKVYSGSDDDERLNQVVKRYRADEAALAELANYEASGVLTRPLVTMHTTRDPVVPISQLAQYSAKTAGSPFHLAIPPIDRDGHCSFTPQEIQQALGLLLSAL